MTEESGQRQLSKAIAEKLEMIGKIRIDLEKLKKTSGNSVDEQILIAEREYRLVKEELALLTLQEKHWESAALWDVHTPEVQREACEVLYSYIQSVREKGAVPTLHVSDHLCPDNAILISSHESIPRVEWAHHSTDLQIGDRLVEVNGHLVVGRESSEVCRMLGMSPVCRLVFVRSLSLYQLMKSNGCKETTNLRQELTSVVSRLNRRMAENSKLLEQKHRLQKEIQDLKGYNHKLKLQVVSLQSLLLYIFQTLEKNNFDANCSNFHLQFLLQHPNILDILKKTSASDTDSIICTSILSNILNVKKIPSLEFNPKVEGNKETSTSLKSITNGKEEKS